MSGSASSGLSVPRNPPWSRDELILALDLYVRSGGFSFSPSSPEVAGLSQLLTTLRQAAGTPVHMASTYRNANGVAMKLMNFRAIDPTYTAKGAAGLRRGNRLETVLWDEFHEHPQRLKEYAEALKAALNDPSHFLYKPVVDDDVAAASEGGLLARWHISRERNANLARRKKEQALTLHGQLTCEACGFNFTKQYGDRGQGFIECHHRTPLHTLHKSKTTLLSDLALVCANCHRMIHVKMPWLTIEQLRTLVQ